MRNETVELIDGRICRDHIHMYVAVPSEMSVSEIYVVSQRRVHLMLFERNRNIR